MNSGTVFLLRQLNVVSNDFLQSRLPNLAEPALVIFIT
ncbi:hypothetical protein BTN49_2422 [Candidatus Enterovibrio escicola]|uniref:Uncharacterized protein n=1 Tax=Candidatus Enterovibrio escicola TaxID=1927127 RepID=A0A2A5T1B6_9GAMM|nr:hypothetical protein BTN49_2422 [Candidatus Enterovibrio escacola]